MRTHPRAVAAILLTAASPIVAQDPPLQRLGAATATSRMRFSEVGGLVELGNGKLLVADPSERSLTLLDFATGRGQPISARGSGPREYRGVGNLIARPDGGAMLVDFAQFRFLPVRPDGIVEEVILYPRQLGRTVRAIDAQGRYYSDVYPPRTGGSERSDTMLIVRWDPRHGVAVDTIGAFDAGLSKWTGRPGVPMPAFAPIDEWVVLQSGEIAIADATHYRIAFFNDGRLVRSAQVPWRPVRFTEADRRAHQEYAAAHPPIPMRSADPARGSPPPMTFSYPATYPAFVRGAVAVDRQGRLWIETSRAASDAVPVFNVLDANGKLLGQVAFPPRGQLAGFGQAALYVAVPNDDDEVAIQRHSLPVFPSR